MFGKADRERDDEEQVEELAKIPTSVIFRAIRR